MGLRVASTKTKKSKISMKISVCDFSDVRNDLFTFILFHPGSYSATTELHQLERSGKMMWSSVGETVVVVESREMI
jgi:hypothetical protein